MRRLLRWFLPSAGSLRLSAYCLVMFGLLSVLAEHLLHARIGESALALGKELSGFAELARDAENVLVGGVRFHHSRVVLDESASLALDRVERECASHPGPLALALSELAARAGKELDRYQLSSASRRGHLRYERDGSGVVICFAAGAEPPAALDEQVRAFSTRRDLSAFGRVRYAFAEPSAEGKTCLTTLWSDDAIDLDALFPESGDSAGTDPHVVPRPRDSRRLLTVAAERMPYGLWLYASRAPARETLGFYDTWFRSHDFRRVGSDAALGGAAYLNGEGLQIFISASEDETGSTLGIVESRSAESSPIIHLQTGE